MSGPLDIAPDQLAGLVSPDAQRTAARMAQDAFAGIFRLSLANDPARLGTAMAELEPQCFNWCQAGDGEAARAVRLALLIGGMDQWGLAYSQAFDLTALPALTALLGALRNRLDAAGDSRFLQYFAQIDRVEADAIDFKVELRRSIHLALWHAMVACDDADEARHILQSLGSLMLAVAERMPQVGWRLLADALASIQISLLADPARLTGLAHENTQQLFAALGQALPKERYQAILAYSGQAVLAWQQSRRPAS